MPSPLRRIFLGPDNKLRMIWRAVLFYGVGTFILFPLLGWPLEFVAKALHLTDGLSAGILALGEFEGLLVALICTGAFALYERRRIDSYGLPAARVFSSQTFEGALAGILMAGAVALGMFALGGMQVNGLAIHGRELVLSALAWFGANIVIALAEESWFRGYFQFSLWRSIGFWPASIASRSSSPPNITSSSQARTCGM